MRRWFGLDGIDVVIHVGVTICIMGVVGVSDGPEQLFPIIMAGSAILFAVRRKVALRQAPLEQVHEGDRLAEVEERLGYLEGLQDRVVELEERLDFTERMLTKQQNDRLPGQR